MKSNSLAGKSISLLFKYLNFPCLKSVMFKTRAAVFYRDLKARGAAEWKHVLHVFATVSKTFLEQRVSREFITMMLL